MANVRSEGEANVFIYANAEKYARVELRYG